MKSSKVVSSGMKAKAMPPKSKQTGYGSQGGSTSPKTDGGGGMGNSCAELHRKIIGK